MKCDEFLTSLETGGILRRWLARRHAGQCPRCAQAAAGLEQLKCGLSDAAPLTRAERQRWLQAAGEPRSLPASRFRWPLLAGAAALAAMLVVAVTIHLDRREPKKISQGPISPPTAPGLRRPTRLDPAQEFARLNGELDRAETEIGSLLQRAELLQASQQATQMLAQYSQW